MLVCYEEGRDDAPTGDDDDKRLPQVMQGEALAKGDITPEQHFTQPPPRYTEATLVKRMEELGIGRPSTYASIVTTIQDREYVRKESAISTLLLTGIWYVDLTPYAAIGMAGFMLAAQLSHLRVQNPFLQRLPSLSYFLMSVFVALFHFGVI